MIKQKFRDSLNECLANIGVENYKELTNLIYDEPEKIRIEDILFLLDKDKLERLTMHSTIHIVAEALRRLFTATKLSKE